MTSLAQASIQRSQYTYDTLGLLPALLTAQRKLHLLAHIHDFIWQ